MPPGHEIDYDVLIDRTIRDFEPVKRLWSVSTRLFFWMLFEAAILASSGAFLAHHHRPERTDIAGLLLALGFPTLASIAAAGLALRGAIPGRHASWRELVLLIAVLATALATDSASSPGPSDLLAGGISMLKLIGLAAFPWSVLFWAVRRGVPLQPAKTGMMIGLAAFSFTLAVLRLIDYGAGSADHLSWLVVSAIVLSALSALAGRLWLDWIVLWQRTHVADDTRPWKTWFRAGTIFPAVTTASLLAFMLVVWATRGSFVPIPDFDLTLDNYQRSLAAGFRSNVPSASIDTVLTAYVEHGMPAYMWDFGPEGFKFVGGRWQPLADGTPVTYTWFRGPAGAVMCMMRQTDAFNPPAGVWEQHHGLLFYKYRGFSVCLINIAGYGDFISVIAAPIPMTQFVPLVLQAVH